MKEEERIEGAQWLQEFFKIRDQLGPLIIRVSKAQYGSHSDRLAAFSEALERMPTILKAMKEAPQPKHKKLRNYKKLEEQALDAYIKSCEWGRKALLEPNRVKQSAIVFQSSLASSYWEIAGKEAQNFLRK
jgi:hypothetical protein